MSSCSVLRRSVTIRVTFAWLAQRYHWRFCLMEKIARKIRRRKPAARRLGGPPSRFIRPILLVRTDVARPIRAAGPELNCSAPGVGYKAARDASAVAQR